MSISYEFATERAQEAALAAETAELDNVRDRALRSEAAWRDMADRARKTEQSRAKREAAAETARAVAQAAAEAEEPKAAQDVVA